MGNYSEKLRDPRWQKKRLEVLNRDEFRCVHCGNDKKELHVHHLTYFGFSNPWDAEECYLITLCSDCHEVEESKSKWVKKQIALLSASCQTIDPIYNALLDVK